MNKSKFHTHFSGRGSTELVIPKGALVTIRTNGNFQVYAEPDFIVGPLDLNSRECAFDNVSYDTVDFQISCKPAVEWTVYIYNRSVDKDPALREPVDKSTMTIPAEEGEPTIQEMVQRLVAVNLSQKATERGFDSFDEANDFDLDEPDGLSQTPYEYQAMDEDEPEGLNSQSGLDPVPEASEDPPEPVYRRMSDGSFVPVEVSPTTPAEPPEGKDKGTPEVVG